MSSGFVSVPERQQAALADARQWLESKGFRIRRHDRSATPIPLFSVTSVQPLITAAQLCDFALRRGWTPPA